MTKYIVDWYGADFYMRCWNRIWLDKSKRKSRHKLTSKVDSNNTFDCIWNPCSNIFQHKFNNLKVYLYTHTKMSPADITFCWNKVNGILMGIGAILMYNYGGYTFDLKIFVYIVIGGLINSFGLLFKGLALSVTFAGPVQAIQNYQFKILSY